MQENILLVAAYVNEFTGYLVNETDSTRKMETRAH
jgi:hypothetical protein